MSYTDAHCHLSDKRFADQLTEILARSEQVQVNRWIQGGVNKNDWMRQIDLKKRLNNRFLASFGIHPWAIHDAAICELDALIAQYRGDISAIGEMGLDHSSRMISSDFVLQETVFKEQLSLAKKWKLPVILHIVNAHETALEILSEHGPHPEGGLVHSFSSSFEVAKKYRDLGYTLSIGSSVTRNGFETLKKTVVKLSDVDFVLETDSPDQPTDEDRAAHRLNEPARLIQVAEAVAKLRGVDNPERVLKMAERNLERIFGS